MVQASVLNTQYVSRGKSGQHMLVWQLSAVKGLNMHQKWYLCLLGFKLIFLHIRNT